MILMTCCGNRYETVRDTLNHTCPVPLQDATPITNPLIRLRIERTLTSGESQDWSFERGNARTRLSKRSSAL